jgi:hypothetical protein
VSAPQHTPERSDLAPLGLDHAASYVLGFPIHVAVTVRGADPQSGFNRLPLPDLRGPWGAIELALDDDATGEPVLHEEPVPRVTLRPGVPAFALRPGESRRALTDLSGLIPADLIPGSYTMRLAYVAFGYSAGAPDAHVTFAAPTREQEETLARLRPDVERARGWGDWTYFARPAPREILQRSVQADDPLRYCRVLRYLLHGGEDLAEVGPALLDVLDGVYAPEAEALRAELLFARGDRAGFEAQAARVRRAHPGLSYWMDRVEAGGGEVTRPFAPRARPAAPGGG